MDLETEKSMGIYAYNVFEREASLVFEQNPKEIHLLLWADIAGTIFTDIIKPLPWNGVAALKLNWIEPLWEKPAQTLITPNKCRFCITLCSFSLQISNSKISDFSRSNILGITDNKEISNKINLEE